MCKKILAMLLAIMMVLTMLVACGDDGYDRRDRDKDDKREEAEEKTENEDDEVDDETDDEISIGDILEGLVTDDDRDETRPVETEPSVDELGPDGETISANEVKENKRLRKYVEELADEYDFNGKTFTWIGGGLQAPSDDEITGNILSDALYYRQRDIEGAFKITWENYTPSAVEGSANHPVVDAVRMDVLAGTGSYDAGYGTPVAVCQPLFMNQCLIDMSTLDGIDFEQEWWPDSLLDTYHIGGALYFVNGPIVTTYYTDAHSVIYNKNIAEDYGIPNLYELVEDNEWTFDKMLEIGEVIPVNTSGSGVYRFSQPNGIAILYANGVTVTQFNDDMTPYVPAKYPMEISNLSDRFAPIFGNDAITANTKGMLTSDVENFSDKYGYDSATEMFEHGRVLFMFGTTGDAAVLRSEDVEFGILPLPKGSAEQENYYSYADPWSTFNVFVPKSAGDTEFTGVILEAMAALGRRYIKPAYYDNLLRSRATYDYESQDMLDIIFDSKVYDIIDFIAVRGSNNEDSPYVKVLKACIQETSDGIASKYDMQARLVKRNIENILKSMEN